MKLLTGIAVLLSVAVLGAAGGGIVLRGRFACAWCPRPPGAPSPHGSIATRIWSPDGRGGGIGIRRKVPPSLPRLGIPTRVALG